MGHPGAMADGPAERGDAAVRWAAVSLLAYAALHHLGTWSAGLGEVGNSGTRWEDWAQPAVPFAVLGPAVLAVAVGVTVATNTLGGGSPALTAVAALAALGYGLRRRGRLGALLVLAVVAALFTLLVAVLVYGEHR